MYKKILLLLVLSMSIFGKTYNKIVVLDPAAVEIMYMIGAENKIVAIAHAQTTAIIPEEKTKKLPSVGNLQKPNIEQILANKPDFVIVGSYADITDTLKKYKIPYIQMEYKGLKDMFVNIETLGKLTGKEKEAKNLIDKSNNRLNVLKEKLKKKPLNLKGTFVYNPSPLMSFGKGSIHNEILGILGVKDIGEGLAGKQPIISPEYAIAQNPDFLIGIMGVKDKNELLRANSFLANTKAGKDGNIHVLKTNKLMRMSPNLIDEIEDIYEFLDKIN